MRSNEGPTSHGHQSQHRDPCPIPPPLHSLEHGRLPLSDTGFRSSSPNYARGRCAERWWHPKRRTNRQTGADACNEERRNAHGHTHQETCLRCRLCICSPAPPARAQRTFVCEVGRSSSPSVSMTPDSRVGHIDLRFGRLTWSGRRAEIAGRAALRRVSPALECFSGMISSNGTPRDTTGIAADPHQ